NANDVSSSQARFAVGLDGALWQRATTSIAFLAREPFAGIEPPGFFDVTRTSFRTGLRYQSPILDLDRSRPSYYDLSVGARVVLWRETLIGFVNFVLPLNDDGFRAGLIPVVGLEAAF